MKRLVVLGGGHSHIEVLRRFGVAPEPDVEIVLVSPDRYTPYSGMMPGWIAGHYTFDECHVDLDRLAAFAGARFCKARVVGIEPERRIVRLDAGPDLAFDIGSIDTGSTPRLPIAASEAGASVIPVKPLARFVAGLAALEARVAAGEVRRIVMVGGGAAGVEVLLALQYRLEDQGHGQGLAYALVTDLPTILAGQNARARALLERVLATRQIALHTCFDVVSFGDRAIESRDGRVLPADVTILATGAAAPEWPRASGLACDADGFVRVDDSLASASHPNVFAAGDIASMVGRRVPKAGVYAVRQGPVLAANLRHALRGEPLERYEPQPDALALIATGGRHAVAARGRWAWGGRWLWRVKDGIDRRFMARYAV